MEDLIKELRDLTAAISRLAESNAAVVASILDVIDEGQDDEQRPAGVYLSGKKR